MLALAAPPDKRIGITPDGSGSVRMRSEVEELGAPGTAEGHGPVLYLDLRPGTLEAGPVEVVHPGIGAEG